MCYVFYIALFIGGGLFYWLDNLFLVSILSLIFIPIFTYVAIHKGNVLSFVGITSLISFSIDKEGECELSFISKECVKGQIIKSSRMSFLGFWLLYKDEYTANYNQLFIYKDSFTRKQLSQLYKIMSLLKITDVP